MVKTWHCWMGGVCHSHCTSSLLDSRTQRGAGHPECACCTLWGGRSYPHCPLPAQPGPGSVHHWLCSNTAGLVCFGNTKIVCTGLINRLDHAFPGDSVCVCVCACVRVCVRERFEGKQFPLFAYILHFKVNILPNLSANFLKCFSGITLMMQSIISILHQNLIRRALHNVM